MKLLEYEAKQLLSISGITIPSASLIKRGESTHTACPVVLKSQVPIGGRGKAGGVVVVESPSSLQSAIEQLFTLPIKGFLPKTLLAEQKLSIAHELYISLSIDRTTSNLALIAHRSGGVDVESNTNFKEWAIMYGECDPEVIGQELANYFNLPDQTLALQDFVQKLYLCLVQNDALVIEINPLIVTTDGQLFAGDCKMTVDDSAAFRHDWQFEEKQTDTNFVTIDSNGNVATIANGAGLAMATVDAVFDAGLQPANFLDIGGGATTETLLKAFARIKEYPNIKAIVINVFAGITRSDEVARAIITAKTDIKDLPPVFIRLAGTNYQDAADLLEAENITLFQSLDQCLLAAKGVVHG